jgi:hypothetical protein
MPVQAPTRRCATSIGPLTPTSRPR